MLETLELAGDCVLGAIFWLLVMYLKRGGTGLVRFVAFLAFPLLMVFMYSLNLACVLNWAPMPDGFAEKGVQASTALSLSSVQIYVAIVAIKRTFYSSPASAQEVMP